MRDKLFITTVDRSLLTLEERKLKRIFASFPKLTLEEAKKVLVEGPKAMQKIDLKKPEPTIEEPAKEVKIDKPTTEKVKSQPKAKAKPKPKKK